MNTAVNLGLARRPLCVSFFHLVYISPQSCTISLHISCLAIYQVALAALSPPSPPPSPGSLFPGGLPFVIDPCPGCLGIDWLSPCHWSSLSILTRFGHPLRCGRRVGERGRHTRCSTAPGDRIKMNERESKTKWWREAVCEAAVCYSHVFIFFCSMKRYSRWVHERCIAVCLKYLRSGVEIKVLRDILFFQRKLTRVWEMQELLWLHKLNKCNFINLYCRTCLNLSLHHRCMRSPHVFPHAVHPSISFHFVSLFYLHL